jgi:hypothetical protein
MSALPHSQSWPFQLDTRKFIVEWLRHLFRTEKFLTSNYGPDTAYPYWYFRDIFLTLQVNFGEVSYSGPKPLSCLFRFFAVHHRQSYYHSTLHSLRCWKSTIKNPGISRNQLINQSIIQIIRVSRSVRSPYLNMKAKLLRGILDIIRGPIFWTLQ